MNENNVNRLATVVLLQPQYKGIGNPACKNMK